MGGSVSPQYMRFYNPGSTPSLPSPKRTLGICINQAWLLTITYGTQFRQCAQASSGRQSEFNIYCPRVLAESGPGRLPLHPSRRDVAFVKCLRLERPWRSGSCSNAWVGTLSDKRNWSMPEQWRDVDLATLSTEFLDACLAILSAHWAMEGIKKSRLDVCWDYSAMTNQQRS